MNGHKAKRRFVSWWYVRAYHTVVHFVVATDNNHLALRVCTVHTLNGNRWFRFIIASFWEWSRSMHVLCEAACPFSMNVAGKTRFWGGGAEIPYSCSMNINSIVFDTMRFIDLWICPVDTYDRIQNAGHSHSVWINGMSKLPKWYGKIEDGRRWMKVMNAATEKRISIRMLAIGCCLRCCQKYTQ